MKAELQRQQDEMEILRKDMKREQLRSDALRKAVAQKSSEVESLRQPLPGRLRTLLYLAFVSRGEGPE